MKNIVYTLCIISAAHASTGCLSMQLPSLKTVTLCSVTALTAYRIMVYPCLDNTTHRSWFCFKPLIFGIGTIMFFDHFKPFRGLTNNLP